MQDAPPPAAVVIDGTLRRVAGGDERPVPGAWVILHRVDAAGPGPVDSVRTDAAGRFRFRRPAAALAADSAALYVVSADRHGIAYLSRPVDPRHTGGALDLEVFDTTAAPLPVAVRGRHVVVGALGAAGTRDVVEVWDLANDSTRTRVSGGDHLPTFEAPLPPRATAIRANGGDIGAAALRAGDGRVRVFAPIAPGLKQLALRYTLPADAPLEFRLGAATDVLEVMVEDPDGRAEGGGLRGTDPVEVEGRRFQRFLAEHATADTRVTVRAPGRGTVPPSRLRAMLIATVIGAALLVGLAAYTGRRFLRPR